MPSYDSAKRRRAQRSGRQKGCWVYFPAEVLRESGVEIEAPPPWYRVLGSRRGQVFIRFYREG